MKFNFIVGMPHIKFPSHYLYWTQVKDHENIKSKLVPIIHNLITENNYDNPFKKDCTMTTNFSEKTDFLDNEMKDKIIWKCLQEMVSETNCFTFLKTTNAKITEYWFNVYEKGDFQEMHQHRGLPSIIDGKRYDTTFSIIYILNSDEEENSTVFKLTDTAIPFHPLMQPVEFDTSKVDEIKEGTILIFSNQLNHFVRPIKKSGRITIAFNVACCFE
jgi:predicted 2-oxoglutarate/Fe(II)-dependent dioxygenase YbiX